MYCRFDGVRCGDVDDEGLGVCDDCTNAILNIAAGARPKRGKKADLDPEPDPEPDPDANPEEEE